jgi:hypothetical protein
MIDVRQSDGYVVVGTHGNGVYSASVTEIPSAVRTSTVQPVNWELSPVYPNPFNSSATIRFTLSAAAAVDLKVFNQLGERVATHAGGRRPAGEHRIRWNGEGMTSGTYLVRMTVGSRSKIQKVLLIR